MPLPFLRRPLKRRIRWALAVVAVLLLLLALPFVFTTSLVRLLLAYSAYARFSPTLSAARLHPSGMLEVDGLTLHELSSSRELLSLGQVKVRFGWRDISGGTVRSIEIQGAKVHLRPSAPGSAAPWPLSTLQLASGETSPAPSNAAPSKPFWYDTLTVAGTLEVEPLPWAPALPTSLPFEIRSHSLADRAAPSRDLSIVIHGQHAPQGLAFSCTMRPDGQRTIIDLHKFSINAIHTAVPLPTALATHIGPQADVSFDSLAVQGTITLDPAASPLADLTMTLDNLSLRTRPPAKTPIDLQHLQFTAHATASLTTAWSADATVSDSRLSLDTLSAGKSSITSLTTPVTLAHGILATPDLHFTLAGGTLTGAVQYDLVHQRLALATLNVQRVDQKQLAENLAPDKLDAEGTTSGTVHLASNAQGTWTGDIELTADGPGKLQIKDQAAAEALAGKLQTGAANGVLPANFSTIVVQQLKDYPYVTGHLRVDAPDGIPAVTLNYTRKPIGPGDPGYAVKTTIAGQPVLASYTIQLPALTVVLQGKSIAELVAMAAGFEKQVADAKSAK